MDEKSNTPEQKKYDMGEMARKAESGSADPTEKSEEQDSSETRIIEIRPAPIAQSDQNILETSDNAWLEGTRGLQRSLILQLQEAKASWLEGFLIGSMRRQVIREVTEKYIMFLREEARMTSEIALKARKSYLEKELVKINKEIYKELADMVGKSIREIETIFQREVNQLESEELRNAYAKYVWTKVFDLMGLEPNK